MTSSKIKPVDWASFKNDEAVVAKLKELMQEIHVSNPEMQVKSTKEVEQAIKDYIATKGFLSKVDVSVSKPNEIGHRIFIGKARSPLSGQMLNF